MSPKRDACWYITVHSLFRQITRALGRLIGSRTGTTRSRYGYDTNNRLTKWDFTTPATGTSGESYTYDTDTSNSISDGTLLYMGLVSGNYLNYTYDSLQRLIDKYIQLYSDGYGQQVWERYFYADDAENGTASTQVSGKNTWIGNTPVHEFEYTYDAAGNITKEREKLSDRTVDYTYDSLGQLTKAEYSNGRTEEYTYDGAGNILSFHNGTTSHTYTYGNNDWRDLLTAVDGQAITYDNVGNPLSYYNGYRYTFSWTEGRKLASSTYDGRTTAYEYNHDGLRTKKEKSDGSYILYDIVDGRAVGETYYSASHAVQYYLRYIFDENAGVIGISLWYPGDTVWTDYYFVKNLQGDVLQVYKASDHSLVTSYTYDSWGNILSKSGSLADINPFRYRGYYYDAETGFYYLQSRYYDPEIGRFINADGLVSTGQGVLGNNMFAYCGNNPVLYRDSYGTRYEISAGIFDSATKNIPLIFNSPTNYNVGGSVIVNDEKATSLLYFFVLTIEQGVGQSKNFDNDKPINAYLEISDGLLGVPEYSVGVNANFDGYGGSVQIGSNHLLSFDVENISHEVGIDNPLGRVYYKYSYANEHGTYAYTKVSLNAPEVCAVLLLAYYAPFALPVVGAFATYNS